MEDGHDLVCNGQNLWTTHANVRIAVTVHFAPLPTFCVS